VRTLLLGLTFFRPILFFGITAPSGLDFWGSVLHAVSFAIAQLSSSGEARIDLLVPSAWPSSFHITTRLALESLPFSCLGALWAMCNNESEVSSAPTPFDNARSLFFFSSLLPTSRSTKYYKISWEAHCVLDTVALYPAVFSQDVDPGLSLLLRFSYLFRFLEAVVPGLA